MWGGGGYGGYGGGSAGKGGGYGQQNVILQALSALQGDGGKGKGWKKNDTIKKVDESCKVWIGNIPAGLTHHELQPHMDQSGKTKFVAIGKFKGAGTATAVYSSPMDAANAVAMLNGSVLGGQAIVVDAWEKGEKTGKGASTGGTGGKGKGGGSAGKGGGYGQQNVILQALSALQGDGGKGKGWKKNDTIKKVDESCKVWIGNIPAGLTHHELQPHMDQSGKTKFVAIGKFKGAGTATAVYSSPMDAANAVAMLNGSVLGGQAIVVDAWEKGEKTGKGASTGGKGGKGGKGWW